MIFVTLGSQKFQFNRLLKALDEIKTEEEIFAQIGYSDYKPVHYAYKRFLDRGEFAETMGKADIVITHGGTGAIIGAVKQGKKVIAVPRLVRYGEHVDDHQKQLIEQFGELNLICSCDDVDELEQAISFVREAQFANYVSNTETIVQSISKYIEGMPE